MLTHHHRKDLMIEGQFLPESMDDLVDLRERLVDLIATGDVDEVGPKFADAVANGITGWLVAKASGQTDTLSAPTRSKYRKVLAALDTAGDGGTTDTGRRGQRGSADLRLVASTGTVAAAVALATVGHPTLALVAAPIIYVM